MKALLLAAGFGTRLGEMTKKTPKCLVKVGQATMLDHWLYKLAALGVNEFFVNTHYLSNQVKEFITNHPLKKKVTILHEPKLLGTGGTIARNIEILECETCFIVHVDNYCLDPLDLFLSAHQHRPESTVLSMLTFNTNTPKNYGVVEVDEHNQLLQFHEKQQNPPSKRANGAVYIASPPFFDLVRKLKPEPSDLSCDIIPALIGKIYCHQTEYYFDDIGTKAALIKANSHSAGLAFLGKNQGV